MAMGNVLTDRELGESFISYNLDKNSKEFYLYANAVNITENFLVDILKVSKIECGIYSVCIYFLLRFF